MKGGGGTRAYHMAGGRGKLKFSRGSGKPKFGDVVQQLNHISTKFWTKMQLSDEGVQQLNHISYQILEKYELKFCEYTEIYTFNVVRVEWAPSEQ